jgi:hypothetical protein
MALHVTLNAKLVIHESSSKQTIKLTTCAAHLKLAIKVIDPIYTNLVYQHFLYMRFYLIYSSSIKQGFKL